MLSHVTGNIVAGNYIGTDVAGARALGNFWGVIIEFAAFGNVVGGTTPGERNVISGNEYGVTISDPGTTHNAITGNFIGTDATGTAALGNHAGVNIVGVGFNRVGGTRSGERNVISGNSTGISIPGGNPTDNLILGNYIGTDGSGARALGNGLGITMDASARHDFIGGTTHSERNVISGNRDAGVGIWNAGVEYNFISGNAIGTDASGTAPLGNGWYGVWVEDYVNHNFIQGNSIAYNGTTDPYQAGVYVTHSPCNTIRRNSIYENVGRGIFLAAGGNNLLPAPVILTVTPTGVSGTACSGCTVEVFSDVEDEGRSYEGSTAADASGAFTFTRAGGLIGPYVTATATDRDGNTSEFSIPQKAWARICLPVILKSKL